MFMYILYLASCIFYISSSYWKLNDVFLKANLDLVSWTTVRTFLLPLKNIPNLNEIVHWIPVISDLQNTVLELQSYVKFWNQAIFQINKEFRSTIFQRKGEDIFPLWEFPKICFLHLNQKSHLFVIDSVHTENFLKNVLSKS